MAGMGGGLQGRDEEGGVCGHQREGELLQSSHSSLSDTAHEETAAISTPHSIPMYSTHTHTHSTLTLCTICTPVFNYSGSFLFQTPLDIKVVLTESCCHFSSLCAQL